MQKQLFLNAKPKTANNYPFAQENRKQLPVCKGDCSWFWQESTGYRIRGF
jgi:hypothetical protein